jgi:AcrR family transcriptional regulator
MAAQPQEAATDAPTSRSVGKRVRKNPATRRAEIVEAARAVFAATGYEDAGLTEISQAANVSKALLYHYFPEGRSALFAAVTEEILAELSTRLAHATKVPFSPRRRLDHLLATLFGFFTEHPETYRHLFEDSRASRDERVVGVALAAKIQITSELAALLASPDRSGDELLAASHGILGFALANVDLCIGGQLDAETAWRVTCEFAGAALRG